LPITGNCGSLVVTEGVLIVELGVSGRGGGVCGSAVTGITGSETGGGSGVVGATGAELVLPLDEEGGLAGELGGAGFIGVVLTEPPELELGVDLELKKLRSHCINSLNDIPYSPCIRLSDFIYCLFVAVLSPNNNLLLIFVLASVRFVGARRC